MIARGFKPVAWVAAVGVAALSCYMLSLRVAAERAELAALDQRILQARQSIRSLQTELGTRGRLQQLEQWNAEVLALSAPVADQFLTSNVSLARFDMRERGFADAEAEVRLAAATGSAPGAAGVQVAAPTAAAPPQPRVTLVAATTIQPARTLAAAPEVRRAAATSAERPAAVVRPTLVGAERSAPASARSEPAPTRLAAAQARTGSLLGDDTMRALRAEARQESGGGTRN